MKCKSAVSLKSGVRENVSATITLREFRISRFPDSETSFVEINHEAM
jgi:hypothetical protein